MKSFELLLAKDHEDYFEIIGVTYSDAMCVEPGSLLLRASTLAIEKAKAALKAGKKITASKIAFQSELLPVDLIVKDLPDLDRRKLEAVNEVAARMHNLLISISVLDLMEYLDTYVKLLNAGYFVTDTTREDVYFKLIEDAQSCEEPAELKDGCTFEEEVAYSEAKKKHDQAQANLATLEKYLNAYDKLSSIRNITDFLTSTREKIMEAKTDEDLREILAIYKSNLKNYGMVNVED